MPWSIVTTASFASHHPPSRWDCRVPMVTMAARGQITASKSVLYASYLSPPYRIVPLKIPLNPQQTRCHVDGKIMLWLPENCDEKIRRRMRLVIDNFSTRFAQKYTPTRSAFSYMSFWYIFKRALIYGVCVSPVAQLIVHWNGISALSIVHWWKTVGLECLLHL